MSLNSRKSYDFLSEYTLGFQTPRPSEVFLSDQLSLRSRLHSRSSSLRASFLLAGQSLRKILLIVILQSNALMIKLPLPLGEASNSESSCQYYIGLGPQKNLSPISRSPSKLSWSLSPLSRHKCCLGCVSLRDAVPLICVIEIILMAWCSMFAIDFAINDGVLFFTKELEGRGKKISAGLGIFIVISLIIIVITLLAWHYRRKKYYILHVLWQLIFVSYIFFLVYILLMRIFVYRNDSFRKMMIPSAITIASFCAFVGICEMWWLFIMVDALLYEGKDMKDCSSRRQSECESYNQRHNSVPVLLINDEDKIDV